jgi:hypothetical protein
MKLLLVPQQEVAAGKASCTFGAFEWLLLRVRTFVTLEMLESCE